MFKRKKKAPLQLLEEFAKEFKAQFSTAEFVPVKHNDLLKIHALQKQLFLETDALVKQIDKSIGVSSGPSNIGNYKAK